MAIRCLFVLELIRICLTVPTVLATTLGDVCNSPSECTDPDYPVCSEGFCANCTLMGDQASCEDAGSGAADFCFWLSGNCVPVAAVPELPGYAKLCLFLAGILVTIHFIRKRETYA